MRPLVRQNTSSPLSAAGPSRQGPTTHGLTQPRATHVHLLVRWAFYLFVFSIPFEYPGRSIPIETTTLTGCLFLLATFLQPRVCYGRRPPALFWFGTYLYMFLVAFVASGGAYPRETTKTFLTLLMLVLIFWASYNLLLHEGVARTALWALGTACVILALMTVASVMTSVDPDSEDEMRRATVLGQNANRAAKILTGGLLALIGLTYARERSLLRPRVLVWPLVALIGLAIIKGGSRGGLLALAVGLWTFTWAGKTIKIKVRNAVVALLVMGLLVGVASQSPLIRRRVELTQQGNLAGREAIFPAAARMFMERPLTGWGAANHYELASRLPPRHAVRYIRRDTHNLVLEIVTAAGILGAVPFLIALWLGVRAAWAARVGPWGILPFTMLAALLTGDMSGNYIALKLHWLVLAFALASGSLVMRRAVRRSHPGDRYARERLGSSGISRA